MQLILLAIVFTGKTMLNLHSLLTLLFSDRKVLVRNLKCGKIGERHII